MTEPTRAKLLEEGRKQARIYGVPAGCAGVYAEGWATARARIVALEAALRAALPIVAYVSTGRRFVDVEPYPDATARRVAAQICELIGVQE